MTKDELIHLISEVLGEMPKAEVSPEGLELTTYIDMFIGYMIESGMNVKPLPTIKIIYGDEENAEKVFGRTAYYDFANLEIVVFGEGRHKRDIVRSLAHEMIHHIQNLEGRLVNVTGTNTNEDDNLTKLEEEANLLGTMTFRKWSDSIKYKDN